MDDDGNVGINNLTGRRRGGGLPSHDTRRCFASPVSARHGRRSAAPGRCRVGRRFNVERRKVNDQSTLKLFTPKDIVRLRSSCIIPRALISLFDL